MITLKTMLESWWQLGSERIVNDAFDRGQHVIDAVTIRVIDERGAVLETVREFGSLHPLLIEAIVRDHNLALTHNRNK